MTSPNENLPAALTHYHRALTALLDPTPDHPDGRYQALINAVPGQQGVGGHHARSMPPLWIDAAQILAQIDTQARKWWYGHHHTKPARKPPTDTPGQLESLPTLKWRPQDTPKIHHYANTITRWATDIDTLTLTPTTHHWTLPSPCPACGTRTTHRQDSAGEHVRQPALHITAEGCTCTHCHTTWAPQLFTHLARVLGYKTPTGVLE